MVWVVPSFKSRLPILAQLGRLRRRPPLKMSGLLQSNFFTRRARATPKNLATIKRRVKIHLWWKFKLVTCRRRCFRGIFRVSPSIYHSSMFIICLLTACRLAALQTSVPSTGKWRRNEDNNTWAASGNPGTLELAVTPSWWAAAPLRIWGILNNRLVIRFACPSVWVNTVLYRCDISNKTCHFIPFAGHKGNKCFTAMQILFVN